MEIINGTAVSSGKVWGKILYFCTRRENFSKEVTDNPEKEVQFLENTIKKIDEELEKDIQLEKEKGKTQEAILTEAHRLLIADIVDQGECRKKILENNYSARRAVYEASTKFKLQFENLDDEFMRDRSYDVRYVMEIMLESLGGNKRKFPKLSEPVIIMADELIPEGTLCFEKNNILGVITKDSSYHSHSSVLARLWHIPAVVGITPDEAWSGQEAVLDGDEGKLYLNPTAEFVEKTKEEIAKSQWYF